MRHVAKKTGIADMNSHGPLVVHNARISTALATPQRATSTPVAGR
jgi:hypothetical protein